MEEVDYFDRPRTDAEKQKGFKATVRAKEAGIEIHSQFNKQQSPDYYEGMVAAARVAFSIPQGITKREDIERFLLEFSLQCTMVAAEKQFA